MHPFGSRPLGMPERRCEASEQERYIKRICCTLDSLLRQRLRLPHQNLGNHFPIRPSVAVLYLREYLENLQDQVSECSDTEAQGA